MKSSCSAWSCRRWSYVFDKVKKYAVRLGLEKDCARTLDLPVVIFYDFLNSEIFYFKILNFNLSKKYFDVCLDELFEFVEKLSLNFSVCRKLF